MRGLFLAGALALLVGAAAPVRAAADGPNMAALLAERPAPTLSAYRLFRDAGARIPNAGVTPYDLATPLFSDYALKQRFVFVPPGAPARLNGDDVFAFPVGAVLVKTFAYPADLRAPDADVRPVETRLLVRQRAGWAAMTYVWDADGREARLQVAGATVPVQVRDAGGALREIAYAVPNKNQCKGCHASDNTLTPIGPAPRHLDREIVYAEGRRNQLAYWAATGLLDAAPPSAPAPASLDAQARAYLDVNCAHCHNPRGPAANSGLDLRATQADPALWGVRKRPVAAGRAAGGFLFAIDPGRPDSSILLYRMQSTDPGVMMPELGRTLVHREGVDLIARWIAAMDAGGAIPDKAN